MSSSFRSSARAVRPSSTVVLAFCAILLLPSCDMFGGDSEPDTRIRFISLLGTGVRLSAHLSGEAIDAANIPPSLVPADPDDVTGFANVESGRRRYQIRTGSSEAESIYQGTMTLAADTFYTAYLSGDYEDLLVTLVGEPNVSAPDEGALLRIVHAYPEVGSADVLVYGVVDLPGGDDGTGELIRAIEDLHDGGSSEIIQTSRSQIRILVSVDGRQAPILQLSPVAGRMYTVVVTQPAGAFANLTFGLATYQEEL